MTELVRFATEDEWLAARRKHVTSSDAPALLGIGFGKRSQPVKSPFSLWCDKTGRTPPTPLDSVRLRVGHYLEPGMMAEHRSRHPGNSYQAVTTPLMYTVGCFACTPDALTLGSNSEIVSGVEFKTVEPVAAEDWQDGPSQYAVVQSHWHMLVMGVERWEIGALIGFSEYRDWPVPRNAELVELLLDTATRFWRCVQEDTPPPMDGYEATRRAIEALYPRPEPGKVVQLTGWVDDVLHLDELGEAVKRLEEQRAAIDIRLRGAIGDAEEAVVLDDAGQPMAKYRYRLETRAAHWRKETTSRVLRKVKV